MLNPLTIVRENVRFLIAHPAHILVIAAAFGVGSAAGVPVEEKIYNYMWSDPGFCDDCHVHDWANRAYEKSAHAGLTTCHDCHLVPIRHYPRNLVITIAERTLEEDEIKNPEVASVICTRCHSDQADDEPLTGPMSEETRSRVVKIDHSPLHLAHLGAKSRTPNSAQGGNQAAPVPDRDAPLATGHGTVKADWDAGQITCMDCHGSGNHQAHRFEAMRDNCVVCHENTDLPGARLGKVECWECHFDGFVGQPGTATP